MILKSRQFDKVSDDILQCITAHVQKQLRIGRRYYDSGTGFTCPILLCSDTSEEWLNNNKILHSRAFGQSNRGRLKKKVTDSIKNDSRDIDVNTLGKKQPLYARVK